MRICRINNLPYATLFLCLMSFRKKSFFAVRSYKGS